MKIRIEHPVTVFGHGFCEAGTTVEVSPTEATRLVHRESVAVFVDPADGAKLPRMNTSALNRQVREAMTR